MESDNKILKFQKKNSSLSEQDMINLAIGLVRLIKKYSKDSMEKQYKKTIDKLLNKLEIKTNENINLKIEIEELKKKAK